TSPNTNGDWKIKIDQNANYIIGRKGVDCVIDAQSLSSDIFKASGDDISEMDIALGEVPKITLEKDTLSLRVGNNSDLGLSITNGSILDASWKIGGFSDYTKVSAGYNFSGKKIGSDELLVTFNDGYGRRNATEKLIKVHVSENSLVIDETNKEALSGSSFIIKAKDAKDLDLVKLIELAKAVAWSTETSTLNEKIEITSFDKLSDQLDVLQTISLYTAKGTKLDIQVVVSSKDNILNFDRETDTAVQMLANNNKVIKSSEVAKLKSSSIDNLVKFLDLDIYSSAKTTKNNDNLIVEVDLKALTTDAGSYVVSSTSGKGAKLLSVITVIPDVYEGNENKDNQEYIIAKDVIIKKSEVSALNSNKLIELSGAKAWKTDVITSGTNTYLKVNVDVSPVKNTVGVYTVTYKTDKGTSVNAKVNVVEDSKSIAKTGQTLNIVGIVLIATLASGLVIVSRKIKK
ncbi:MAG: hypothetical protein ACRCTA_01710, partial [Bacilli bacterium]